MVIRQRSTRVASKLPLDVNAALPETAMTSKTAAKKPTRSARRPGIRTAKSPAAKPAKAPAPAAQKKAPAAKPERATRSGLAYAMIQKGATNAEVWEALRAAFNMPETHSYYPSWYRARLVMDGVITKAFAAEHRGPALARKPAAAK